MDTQKKPTLAEKQAFWAEQLPNFEAKYWLSDRAEFLVFDMEQGNYVVKDGLDPIYEDDANDTFHRVNTGWAMWKKAIVFCRDAQKVAVPDGFVLVPTKNVKFFSNDGENYEIHDTLEEAKKEAESAIEWFSEQLADQQLDPSSDGNFHQVGYGIILAESSHSIDHVVTQEDVDNGNNSYEVGTQIMSLFLIEAQEQSHD